MGASIGAPGKKSGRRRRGVPRYGAMAEINMTPFIDVMLVLLIIFMVAAPLITGAIPLDLPRVSGPSSTPPATKPIVINVDSGGTAASCTAGAPSIGEQSISPQDVIAKVKAVQDAGGADERIIINASRAVCYESVLQLLGQLRAAGFTKATINIEPIGK